MLRYQLLPPDIVDRDEFVAFWQADAHSNSRRAAENKAKRRLRFDVDLEFGLQSRTGRTLELTGSVAAEVVPGCPAEGADPRAPRARARRRHATAADRGVRRGTGPLGARRGGTDAHPRRHPPRVAAAVRGEERQPLPRLGRPAARPGHARVPERPPRTGVPGAEVRNRHAARGLRPGHRALVVVRPVDVAVPGRQPARRHASWPRRCSPNSPSRCCCPPSPPRPAPPSTGWRPRTVHRQRAHRRGTARRSGICWPATSARPRAGQRHHRRRTRRRAVHPDPLPWPACTELAKADNFYRRLYASTEMQRVVAREHTSLLDDETRLDYETAFKRGGTDPQAPNVLVATPTLEMGIDIGDLSTVMLASLPRSVSSYLQRVGRAGRLTGNALNLAYVTRPRRTPAQAVRPAVGDQGRGAAARDVPAAPRRSCAASTSPTSSTSSPATPQLEPPTDARSVLGDDGRRQLAGAPAGDRCDRQRRAARPFPRPVRRAPERGFRREPAGVGQRPARGWTERAHAAR